MADAYIDYDPRHNDVSTDTQEQSGHTPPDYNTTYPTATSLVPSPAREDVEDEEGLDLQDLAGEPGFDPAEMEWLIYNSSGLDEEVLLCETANLAEPLNSPTVKAGEEALAETKVELVEEGEIMHITDITNNAESEQPLMKSPLEDVRRSVRITNRSGPIETIERYTLAARKKWLEMRDEAGNKKTGTRNEGRTLNEEEWESVAEGAGYIVSPRKKERVGSLIKGSIGLHA